MLDRNAGNLVLRADAVAVGEAERLGEAPRAPAGVRGLDVVDPGPPASDPPHDGAVDRLHAEARDLDGVGQGRLEGDRRDRDRRSEGPARKAREEAGVDDGDAGLRRRGADQERRQRPAWRPVEDPDPRADRRCDRGAGVGARRFYRLLLGPRKLE